MKTHVITLSKAFPSYHVEAGEPTHFSDSLLNGAKLHTLRLDPKNTWANKIAQVNQGTHKLSVREWTSRPYNSKQNTIIELTKGQVATEPIFYSNGIFYVQSKVDSNLKIHIPTQNIAANDGLSTLNFKEWFKKVKDNSVLTAIHFFVNQKHDIYDHS